MHYWDSDGCPKTYEEYRRDAIRRSVVSAEDARRILRERGVRGRSKMDAREAKRAAEEADPDGWRELVMTHVRPHRWPIAHGLELDYDELATIERTAGVDPIDDGSNMGGYASLDDAERVYAAALEHTARYHSIRLRMSYGGDADAEAAEAVMAALRESFDLSDASVYDSDRGGRNLYVTALVPRG